jgi:hypothetical protein
MRHCDVEPAAFRENEYRLFSPEDFRWVCRVHPGLESIAGHSVSAYAKLEEVRKDVRYFSLLRNPIEQVASFFQFVCTLNGKELDFEETIAEEWLRNIQTRRLAGIADAGAARQMIIDKGIFIGLQERFDHSMLMLRELVDRRLDINYVNQHVASNQTIAQHLLNSDRHRELIEEAVGADIELYEWVRRELYPSYEQRYSELTGKDISSVGFVNRQAKCKTNRILNLAYRNGIFKPLIMLRRLANHRA